MTAGVTVGVVRARRWRVLTAVVAATALLAACSDLGDLPGMADPSADPPTSTAPSPPPEAAPTDRIDPSHLSQGCAGTPAADVAVSVATGRAVPLAVWRCADRAVVVGDGDAAIAAVAATWAAATGGVLRVTGAGDPLDDLETLAPDEVTVINDATDVDVPGRVDVGADDATGLAVALLAGREVRSIVVAHAGDRSALAAGALVAAAAGDLLVPLTLPASTDVVDVLRAADRVTVVGRTGTAANDLMALLEDLDAPADAWMHAPSVEDLLRAVPAESARLRASLDVLRPGRRGAWIVPMAFDDSGPEDLLHLAQVAAAAGSAGLDVVARDVRDLRRRTPDDGLLADVLGLPGADPGRPGVVVSAPAGDALVTQDDVTWQLDVNLAGRQVPGGGQVLFPHRRLVALYGHPNHGSLGVFGEQPPEAAVERALAVAAGYDADGIPTIPAFDVITTLASASATPDGDYSAPVPLETMRSIHAVARANGVYLVLDLQPGRTDFLTQAKMYEELLREPDVGLALDPEWRLKPNQVHLRQVGTVDAAEVNRVVDYLAGIVREEALPQKLLIVHQFRFSMITNRETIRTPAELAVMIHMDGQGGLFSKYDTYDAIIDPGQPWWPGWKNFYDEDRPMATPQQVLALEPTPWFVSFQ